MKRGFFSSSTLRQTETCSDCIERGDVNLLGQVIADRQARVADCMGCLGTGRQTREKPDVVAWWVSNRARLS